MKATRVMFAVNDVEEPVYDAGSRQSSVQNAGVRTESLKGRYPRRESDFPQSTQLTGMAQGTTRCIFTFENYVSQRVYCF